MAKTHFILIVSLCLIISLSTVPIAQAIDQVNSLGINTSTTGNTGVQENDPTLTPEKVKQYFKEAEKRTQLAREWLASQEEKEISIMGHDYYNAIPVPRYKQETAYYCGPACVQQALGYHKNSSGSSASLPTQATLAGLAGTTTSGSTTSGLKKAINSYASTYKFNNYVISNVTEQDEPLYWFKNTMIRYDIDKGRVPTVLVYTKYIPRYGGKNMSHYICISGYDYSMGNSKVRTVDPNYLEPYGGIFWDDVGSTTADGVFKAVYLKDQDTTNYAVLW